MERLQIDTIFLQCYGVEGLTWAFCVMYVYLCSFLTCVIFDTFECHLPEGGFPQGPPIICCHWRTDHGVEATCTRTMEGHTGAVWSVTWFRNRRGATPHLQPKVLSGTNKNYLILFGFNLAILALIESLANISKNAEVSMSFPDAFSSGQDGTLRRWSLTDGRCLQEFQSHGDAVRWGLGNRTDFTIPPKRIHKVPNSLQEFPLKYL